MLRFVGIFALFPITMTLTISFFVLFTREKAAGSGLKSFATVVAVLLWLCALLALIAGIRIMSGHVPCCMHGHNQAWMAPCPQNAMPAPPAAMPAPPAKK